MDIIISGFKLVGGFFWYILKGVLISVIASVSIFIIGVSVMTKKFPPDLSQYQKKIAEVQGMLNFMSENKDLLEPSQKKTAGKLLSPDDMIALQNHRQKMGREIAGIVEPDPAAELAETRRQVESLRREVEFLKARVLQLEAHKK